MQINGSPLTSAFNIRPDNALNDRARLPVTIDSQAVFDLEQQNQSLPAISSTTKQQQITSNDSQQARFVRLFATQAEPSSASSSTLPVVAPPALPQGVEQYLQVSKLPSIPQRLFDQTV
ncbi:MAG: hypothetical protein IBX57_02185 [Gammaproteobacteria bacterium]|nr:hypothetical protein [Gammaproteobacteria bacterium]